MNMEEEILKLIEKNSTVSKYAFKLLNKDQLTKDIMLLLQQTPCTTQLPVDSSTEDEYCKCEYPTLGKSVSRCGTCDCWFKPIA